MSDLSQLAPIRISIRPPFPYFGGKRRVAPLVWQLLGNPKNYVEAFAGGLSTLLLRPPEHFAMSGSAGAGAGAGAGGIRIETLNELSPWVANFWRAVHSDPEQVAYYTDWIISEADLHARHLWLINNQVEFRERMLTDPDYYDAKLAGWWVWGLCQWIGAGWCERRPSSSDPKKHYRGGEYSLSRNCNLNSGGSALGAIAVGADGGGDDKYTPTPTHLYTRTRRKIPRLSDPGNGVHASGIHSGGGGNGGSSKGSRSGGGGGGSNTRSEGLYAYFEELHIRLRNVRVICGDFERVLTRSVAQIATGDGSNGIFLDPPYPDQEELYGIRGNGGRDKVFYRAAEWCRLNGDNPKLRIVLCGYEGDFEPPQGWTTYPWRANKGYAGKDNHNRDRERIWASPACLVPVSVSVRGVGVRSGAGAGAGSVVAATKSSPHPLVSSSSSLQVHQQQSFEFELG